MSFTKKPLAKKHSPIPWSILIDDEDRAIDHYMIWDAKNKEVCKMNKYDSEARQFANAELLLAGPKMIQELKRIIPEIKEYLKTNTRPTTDDHERFIRKILRLLKNMEQY